MTIDGNYMRDKAPVRHCDVYKEIGCAHVDGYLCNMSDCDILSGYKCEKVQKSGSNQPVVKPPKSETYERPI